MATIALMWYMYIFNIGLSRGCGPVHYVSETHDIPCTRVRLQPSEHFHARTTMSTEGKWGKHEKQYWLENSVFLMLDSIDRSVVILKL